MWTLFDAAAFAAGFVACWFAKDKIVQAVSGTEVFVKTLEAKAAALKAAL
jgi:hypothetical protein